MEDANSKLVTLVNLMMMEVGSLVKAFYKKYGKESLPVISEVMAKRGEEWGKIMQQSVPVKKLSVLGEQAKVNTAMIGARSEVVESTDSQLRIKMFGCPHGLEGSSKELCEAMEIVDEKRVSTFLGKPVKLQVLKSRAGGDKYCEVLFSIT